MFYCDTWRWRLLFVRNKDSEHEHFGAFGLFCSANYYPLREIDWRPKYLRTGSIRIRYCTKLCRLAALIEGIRVNCELFAVKGEDLFSKNRVKLHSFFMSLKNEFCPVPDVLVFKEPRSDIRMTAAWIIELNEIKDIPVGNHGLDLCGHWDGRFLHRLSHWFVEQTLSAR